MNTTKLVMVFTGARAQLAAIAAAAAAPRTEVIAVACDLGHHVSLTELHDRARAAGAARCHAVDLREEYLRDVVMPALAAGVAVEAAPLIERTLARIAQLEGAVAMPYAGDTPAAPLRTRSAYDYPLTLELEFVDRRPVSINGIPMTIVELVESLETIAAQPAIELLRLAYAELARSGQNTVMLRVVKGDARVVAAAPALA